MRIFFFLTVLFLCIKSQAQVYQDYDAWVRALESKDVRVKYAAALALELSTPQKAALHRRLLGGLSSKDPFVVSSCAKALGSLNWNVAVSLPALIKLFEHKDITVREAACVAVICFGRKSVNYLLSAMQAPKKKLWTEVCGEGVSETSVYSMIALRNIDPGIVSLVQNRKGIPKEHKRMIAIAYKEMDQQQIDAPESIQMKDFSPFTSEHFLYSRIGHHYMCVSDSICIGYNNLSVSNVTGRLDTCLAKGCDDEAFAILTNNPALFKQYETIYHKKLSVVNTFSRANAHLYLSLANVGREGAGLLPLLLEHLKRYPSVTLYNIIGHIMTDRPIGLKIFGPTGFDNPYVNRRDSFSACDYFGISAPTGYLNGFYPDFWMPYFHYSMNSSEEEDKQEYTRYRRDADGFKATTEIIPPADREGTELDPSDSLVREFLSWGMASKDADIWHASLLWLKSVNWLDKPYFDFAKKHFFSPSKITRQIAADVFIAHDTTFAGFENVSSYYIWEKSKAAFFAREYNRMFEGDRDINVGCGWGAGPGGEVTLPILNWPLPPSSVRDVIPLVKYKTAKVESLHQAITRILSQKGYPYRFFTVPNGYAIVTQVEQMNGDGSLAARDRWILKRTSSSAWKLGTFLNGNEGWFRQFYFVINTNPNFKDNGELFKTVTKFLTNFEEGGFVLPEEVKNTPLKNMYLNVLVYQFYKKNGGVIRTIRKGENPLPASTHLRVLGITEF